MDERQITEFMLSTKAEIAALWETAKSAHKRIDGMGELPASVNNLAREVGRVAEKVEYIAERMDKTIERIEQGQKDQGSRIGNVEKIVLAISQNEKAIEKQGKRLDEITKAPADKWDKLTWIVISVIATAVVSFLVGGILQ